MAALEREMELEYYVELLLFVEQVVLAVVQTIQYLNHDDLHSSALHLKIIGFIEEMLNKFLLVTELVEFDGGRFLGGLLNLKSILEDIVQKEETHDCGNLFSSKTPSQVLT